MILNSFLFNCVLFFLIFNFFSFLSQLFYVFVLCFMGPGCLK